MQELGNSVTFEMA